MKDLSPKAVVFILSALLIGGLIGASYLPRIHLLDPWLWVMAVLASVAQVLKVEGATHISSYNTSWLVYGLTFVTLGVPALLFVILISHLVEWAWYKYPWYIQTFNMATFMVAGMGTGLIYQSINPSLVPLHFQGAIGMLVGLAAFTLINHFLVGMVIKLARGQSFAQSGVFASLTLMIDYAMIAMGASAALVWMINPFAILLGLLPIYVLYSTLRVPALQRQTEIDSKTGLYNARHFAEALNRELARADRYERPLCVVMGDLDLLRNINNTYGHLAGDKVLIGIAQILQKEFRDYDLVARFGGEEFAILMPETLPEEVYPRVEKVRASVEAARFEVPTSMTPIQATISFGVAGREYTHQTAEDIIHHADIGLYHAKLNGRNKTYLYKQQETAEFLNGEQIEPILQDEAVLQPRLNAPIHVNQPNPMREEAAAHGQEALQKEKPKNHTKPSRAKPPNDWIIDLYVGTVLVLGIVSLALVYKSQAQIDWLGLAVFALIVLATEGLSIDIYVRDTSVSTAAAPLIAGVLIFGPPGALVLSLTLAGTAMFKHHSQISRFFFNTGNHLISSSVAIALLLATGMPLNEQSAPVQFGLAVIAGLAVFIFSTWLVAEAMALSMRQPILSIWKESFAWLWLYYLAFGVGAYALILGYQFAGVVGALAVMIPLITLRLSQVQFIEQTKKLVTQLKTQNVELENYAQEISTLYENLLHSLSGVIDLRDTYTHGHSDTVSELSVLIGKQLGLSAAQLEPLRMAGILHDIGKIGIPDAILFKPGPLTKEEYELVKQHPVRGADIVIKNKSLARVAPFIRYHHERIDGRGYPDGLSGEYIPLEARLLCVADAVEAMSSDRPYRKAMSLARILQELDDNAGTQFDRQVVTAFNQVVADQGKTTSSNLAKLFPTSAIPNKARAETS